MKKEILRSATIGAVAYYIMQFIFNGFFAVLLQGQERIIPLVALSLLFIIQFLNRLEASSAIKGNVKETREIETVNTVFNLVLILVELSYIYVAIPKV